MSDLPPIKGKIEIDVTDFKTGIAELNRATRVIESGFRAAAAGMDDWAKSADGLEMRIESLTKEMELQEKKVELLRKEYERIAEEKGKDSRAAQEFLIKLNKENEVLGKQQVELAQTEKKLEEMGKESRDAGRGAGEFADKEDQARTATGRLRDALDGLKARLSTLGNDFKALGDKVLKGLAVGIAAVGAAAAGAVVGIGKLVLSTAAAADNIVESAEKLGITAEQYQEFGFVADQIGTDVDTIGRAFARTTKAMGEAEKGTSPAAKAFETLGINVKDANGNFRDTEAVFSDVIGALGNVKDETEREILAQQLFGKSYQELLPLINLGADGLANMTEEARNMGAVMSEEAVNAAADLNDKIAALKAGFKGIMSRLAGAFMPLVTKVVDKLKEMLTNPQIQAGIDRLIKGIGEFATVIGNVLDKLLAGDLEGALSEIFPKETVKQVIAFGKAIKDVVVNVIIPFVKKHAEGIKAAIVGIGAVLAGAGIVSLIAAIANPLGLIIAAVGLLAAAWAEDWGGIRTTITDWWNNVGKPIFEKLVEWLQVVVPIAIQTLSDFWTNTLLPAMKMFWDWVQATVFPIIETFINYYIENFIKSIKFWSEVWSDVLQPALAAFWSWVETTVFPIIKTLYDWLATNVPAALQTLSDFWTNTLRPAIEGVWSWMSTVVFPFWESFANLLSTVVGVGLEALAAIWENVLLPTLTTVYEFIRDKLQPVWDALSEFFSKTFGPVLDGFRTGPWKSFQDVLGEVNEIIGNVKDTFDNLAKAITDFKLPAWATRHSPSPFEQVFLGANEAIKDLQREFPKLAGDLKLSLPDMGSKTQAMQPAPVYVTVNAAVASQMDVYDLAYRVADVINRRR